MHGQQLTVRALIGIVRIDRDRLVHKYLDKGSFDGTSNQTRACALNLDELVPKIVASDT
jgi:hypothetical protein